MRSDISRSVWLSLFGVIAAQAMHATVTFNAPIRDYPLASVSSGSVMADFNHDGIPDVAALAYPGINVVLGNGHAGFGAALVTPLQGSSFYGLVAADFDHDGNLDLATELTGSSGAVVIAFGDGTGAFPRIQTIPVGFSTQFNTAFVSADINGDGNPDIVLNNSSALAVLLGDGSGGFSAPVISPGGTSAPKEIQIADLNHDGKPDIVMLTSNNSPYYLVSFLGVGDGTFVPQWNVAGGDPLYFTLADLNGDGNMDLLVAGSSGLVELFPGTRQGGFGAGSIVSELTSAVYFAASDFNGDSIPDLVVFDSFGSVAIEIGDGKGSFSKAGSAPSPLFVSGLITYPGAPLIGDLNGDGTLDVASCYGEPFVSVTLLTSEGKPITAPSYPSSLHQLPGATVTADFNGDGHPDVAALSTSLLVSLATGNSAEPLAPAVTTTLPSAYFGMAAGDWNGDGRQDLALGGENEIMILLGNGDGTFHAGATIASTGTFRYVAQGDFNGDGKLDLIAADSNSPTITVFAGNGDGTFRAGESYAIGSPAISLLTADFNGDGRSDVVVAEQANPNLKLQNRGLVFLAATDGTLQAPEVVEETNGVLLSALAGDINHDGKLDVVFSGSNTFYVCFGKGDGTFTQAISGITPQAVTILADFDGDGFPELAGSDIATNNVFVLQGDGKGHFGEALDWAAGPSPAAALVLDLNRDGRPDVVTLNFPATRIHDVRESYETYTVLTNTSH